MRLVCTLFNITPKDIEMAGAGGGDAALCGFHRGILFINLLISAYVVCAVLASFAAFSAVGR